jgi:hypothetical protein
MSLGVGRIKLPILLLVALILAILLILHAPFMNGPYYWKWPWRRLDALRYFPGMLLCATPLFVAVAIHKSTRLRTIICVALVMLSMFAMQIVHIGMTVKPFSLGRVTYVVESPMHTSYFTDAVGVFDEPLLRLLPNYPQHMRENFDMHSREKPPGPILFFRALMNCFGVSDQSALIAGIVIGVLATLTIPATYALILVLLKNHDAAFAGATLLAISPGLTLHFPMLDQIYPAITCPLLIAWVLALRRRKFAFAIAFGAILAVACFIVYQFLVLGAFLAIVTIAHAAAAPTGRLMHVVRLAAAAIATCVAFYFLLYLVTGFDAIAVFRTALENQRELLSGLIRPWPRTILFDLTDFVMGAGWLPVVLAITALCNREVDPTSKGWIVLCIAQIVILALTGLIQTETARVWCFLLPLLMLAASVELSRWRLPARLLTYAAAWLLMCCVGQNMAFMF